jgi:hypothetical protein
MIAGYPYNLVSDREEPAGCSGAGLALLSAAGPAIFSEASFADVPRAPAGPAPPAVTGGDFMQAKQSPTVPDLPSLLRQWFPPLRPADLDYESEWGDYSCCEIAHLFTLARVSVCGIGCTGGYVAAITGVYSRYVARESGPEEEGQERVTIRVEFEGAADLADRDRWAEGIRARLNREYPWRGLVGLEADPALVVTADLSREQVVA